MPLRLLPVTEADFPAIIAHASEPSYVPGDDLVAPPNPVVWPVSTREQAQTRLRICMSLQERRFRSDPSCNFLKVVDLSSPEADPDGAPIVALARWHRYPEGYRYADEAHWEHARLLPASGELQFPPGFNAGAHDYVLACRDALRPAWQARGRPTWVLMHLVTRASARRRGAARMLIEWGLDRAKAEGAPAYLEAGEAGKPVYGKFGFEQVGELRKIDLTPFGMDVLFEMANMVCWPGGERSA
jgi:GNAT superfamily N-acetyltransferase